MVFNQIGVRFIAVSHRDLYLDQLRSSLYTEDVVMVFHHHHLFADDKQVYSATSKAQSIADIATRKHLVSYILDVRDWCTSRWRWQNLTSVVQECCKSPQDFNNEPVDIGCDLGVRLQAELTMKQATASQVTSSYFFQRHQIRRAEVTKS